MPNKQTIIEDANNNNWVDKFAPKIIKPYLRLMRLDRPIGFWLLFWPCVFSLFLALIANPTFTDWNLVIYYLFLFLLGSIIMRGGGCTLNDIIDRDIDKKVTRTRFRPIPSGQISVRNASIFLFIQLFFGLIILLQFNNFTILLGASSLILVVIYPFMKRISYWPQLFLGLAFSWGALIGWSAIFASISIAPIFLYIGAVLWIIGYDTIYAMQDIEDDALIGVKSTALLFAKNTKIYIGLFYLGAIIFWLLAGLFAGADLIYFFLIIVPFTLLIWQLIGLDSKDKHNILTRFKANHYVGLALSFALLMEIIF